MRTFLTINIRNTDRFLKVYSPHTAVDAASGGLGDWLADIVTGSLPIPEREQGQDNTEGGDTEVAETNDDTTTTQTGLESSDDEGKASSDLTDPFIEKGKSLSDSPAAQSHYVSANSSPRLDQVMDLESSTPIPARVESNQQLWAPLHAFLRSRNALTSPSSPLEHTRTVVNAVPGHEGKFSDLSSQTSHLQSDRLPKDAGYGRLVKYAEAHPLTEIITLIATALNNPAGFPVAIPQGTSIPSHTISSVAVCAGSGASVLHDTTADLIFTGEMSHHDALRFTELGKCVICLFHSNSERGYLEGVMRAKLEEEVRERWEKLLEEMDEEERETWNDDVRIETSLVDRDPFGLVVLQNRIGEGRERGVGQTSSRSGSRSGEE